MRRVAHLVGRAAARSASQRARSRPARGGGRAGGAAGRRASRAPARSRSASWCGGSAFNGSPAASVAERPRVGAQRADPGLDPIAQRLDAAAPPPPAARSTRPPSARRRPAPGPPCSRNSRRPVVPQVAGDVDVDVAAGDAVEQEVARPAAHRHPAHGALRVAGHAYAVGGRGQRLRDAARRTRSASSPRRADPAGAGRRRARGRRARRRRRPAPRRGARPAPRATTAVRRPRGTTASIRTSSTTSRSPTAPIAGGRRRAAGTGPRPSRYRCPVVVADPARARVGQRRADGLGGVDRHEHDDLVERSRPAPAGWARGRSARAPGRAPPRRRRPPGRRWCARSAARSRRRSGCARVRPLASSAATR